MRFDETLAYGDSRIGLLVKVTLKRLKVSLPVRFLEICLKRLLKETLNWFHSGSTFGTMSITRLILDES